MRKLAEAEVERALQDLPEWGLVGESINRTYAFADFRAAMSFINAVAEMAERVQNAAKDLHLAVRGYYGEGSVTDADFFQVSNQTTLGSTEEALLAEFRDVVLPRLVAYEREARQQLLTRDRLLLEDRVHRAQATLCAARLLAHDEAMRLLSRVRLGAALGLLPVDMARVQRLMLEIQPAHLSLLRPEAAGGDDAERSVRADYVRSALS